jgi:hypothetical protein
MSRRGTATTPANSGEVLLPGFVTWPRRDASYLQGGALSGSPGKAR